MELGRKIRGAGKIENWGKIQQQRKKFIQDEEAT